MLKSKLGILDYQFERRGAHISAINNETVDGHGWINLSRQQRNIKRRKKTMRTTTRNQ